MTTNTQATNFNTKVRKNIRNHWEAVTTFDLDLVEGEKHVLDITTTKNFQGALYTSASVGKVEGAFVSHVMYQDFRKILNNIRGARCTEKLTRTQHEEALKDIDNIKAQAVAHYKKLIMMLAKDLIEILSKNPEAHIVIAGKEIVHNIAEIIYCEDMEEFTLHPSTE